jgi:hypothetical protein
MGTGQNKDLDIFICCFSAKQVTLISKSKYCLAANQDNVSEWSNMSVRDYCFRELALYQNMQLSVLF